MTAVPLGGDLDLRDRPAAASVITECLSAQSAITPRGAVARFFGVSPLTDESRPWYLGALGEIEVARRLGALDAGWLVLHAVPIGSGSSDIDHVVVGRGGVFTINTKFHEGKDIWIGGKRILVGGQRTDHLRNARFEATRAAQFLSEATGHAVGVTPVLVFVGARRITIRERPDVVVLRERELVRWLRKRAASISAEALGSVITAAADASTWHRDPTFLPVDLASFDELRTDVRRARGRRAAWALAGLAAVGAASAPLAAAVGTLTG